MKSVLLSVKPQYVAEILNHRKTIEIRKTMPKCELPITVYIYCTQGKYLFAPNGLNEHWWVQKYFGGKGKYNGKIVARFTLKSVGKIKNHFGYYDMGEWTESHILEKSCLSYDELDDYLQTDESPVCGYGWHISDLVIFDEPKEVKGRVPQSWAYLEGELL